MLSFAAMQQLPDPITRAEYRALRAEPARWRGAAAVIAAANGVASEPLRPLGGSNLVAALGDGDVLKLFPPFLRHQWEAERRALALIQGRVGVATPALRCDGEHDGWTYLIMSRLAGAPLDDVWPALDEVERCDLLVQIGALIAEVQRVPPGSLVDLEPSWDDRLRDQRAGCVARHRERGLPAALVDDLDRFLDRVTHALPAGAPPVLLTGEYTPENLLVARDDGRLRIVGLIDFGDATTGPAEYDLLGPGTFLAAGDPVRLRALLEGRGYAREDLTPRFRDCLMALLLLHRHSDLPVQVRIEGWRERARTLDELAAIVWPF
jgi:hygromycin-B 7''-O-kinase